MSLSGQQWRFIAARLVSATDTEAAEAIRIHPTTVSDWRTASPEFVAELDRAFSDVVNVAKERLAALLCKATQRVDEALDAADGAVPDYRARLEAARLLLQANSMLTQKVKHEGDLTLVKVYQGLDVDKV